MRIEDEQLKKFLIDFNLISKEEILKAEKKAKKEDRIMEEVLLSDNIIEEKDLAHLKAYILGIPFIKIGEEKIPLEVLKIIPEPIARKHNIIAYKKNENRLEVAMLDPNDLQTIEFIRKKSNLKILSRLTTRECIKNALMQYEDSLESEFGKIIKKESGAIREIKEITDDKKSKKDKKELEKVAEEVPTIRIVDTLIKHSIIQRSSDIHIEPGEKELIVRYRIDGILHEAMVLPRRVHSGIIARIKVLASLKLDEHRLPQDGRFKIQTEDYKVSFRVSVLPTFFGEKIVMRLLPETSKAPTLEGLGFTEDTLEKVHSNIRRPYGLILVTGPTGSGKTTTLYSILDILNTSEVNISTIEDPVEYTMSRVNQTQINSKIGFTFSSGLRALVRQDPDIIMVGEIRDEETSNLAINAALTGHLVLASLHTNSAAGAISRLVDMKVEPFLISSTLKLVVAQRLTRRIHSSMDEYSLSSDEIKDFSEKYEMDKILEILKKEKVISGSQDWKDVKFGKPKDTKSVPGGYKGRCGIYEVLGITESIKELIIQNASMEKIQQQAQNEGMITMFEDGFVKAARRITTIEEILRVTREE